MDVYSPLGAIANVFLDCSVSLFSFYCYITISQVKLNSRTLRLKFILYAVILAAFLIFSSFAISGTGTGTLYLSAEILRIAVAAVILKFLGRDLERTFEIEDVDFIKQFNETVEKGKALLKEKPGQDGMREKQIMRMVKSGLAKKYLENREGGKGFAFAAIASLTTLSVSYISIGIVLIIGMFLPVLPPVSSFPIFYIIAVVISVFVNLAFYKFVNSKERALLFHDASTRKFCVAANGILLGLFFAIRFWVSVEGPYSSADIALVAALLAVIVFSAWVVVPALGECRKSLFAVNKYYNLLIQMKNVDAKDEKSVTAMLEEVLETAKTFGKMRDKTLAREFAEITEEGLKAIGIDSNLTAALQ